MLFHVFCETPRAVIKAIAHVTYMTTIQNGCLLVTQNVVIKSTQAVTLTMTNWAVINCFPDLIGLHGCL
jgi:hypothetical protein